MNNDMSKTKMYLFYLFIYLFDQGRIQGLWGGWGGGGGWVSITPLNIPKIPCFFQNFSGGMPPDPPITGWSTCNPLFVLVWIRPC